jgi:hypothetical protein
MSAHPLGVRPERRSGPGRRVLRPGGELYLLDRDRAPARGDPERARALAEVRCLLERLGFVALRERPAQRLGVGQLRLMIRAQRPPG